MLSGHVHAYERLYPTYNGHVDPCGITYLNLGDGGNREGAYVPWLEPQPAWSAFRESSFGVGLLTFVNSTHAKYNWTRTACASANASQYHMDFDAEACATATPWGDDNSNTAGAWVDEAWIVRGKARASTASCSREIAPPPPPAACSPDEPTPPPAPPPPDEGGGGRGSWATVDAGGRAAAFAIGLVSGMLIVAAAWACTAKRGGSRGPSNAVLAKAQQLQELRTAELPVDATTLNVRVTD